MAGRAFPAPRAHLGGQQLVVDGENDVPWHASFVESKWCPPWSSLGAVLVAELLKHVSENGCSEQVKRISKQLWTQAGPEKDARRGKATSEVWKRRPSSVILTERASTGRSGLSSRAARVGVSVRSSQCQSERRTSSKDRFPCRSDEERVAVIRDMEDE